MQLKVQGGIGNWKSNPWFPLVPISSLALNPKSEHSADDLLLVRKTGIECVGRGWRELRSADCFPEHATNSWQVRRNSVQLNRSISKHLKSRFTVTHKVFCRHCQRDIFLCTETLSYLNPPGDPSNPLLAPICYIHLSLIFWDGVFFWPKASNHIGPDVTHEFVFIYCHQLNSTSSTSFKGRRPQLDLIWHNLSEGVGFRMLQ